MRCYCATALALPPTRLLAIRVSSIYVVDISKEVFDLADSYSGSEYSNPLRDPRVTTFVQDGRFFLQVSPDRYDIITGWPPPLKVAGTVNLYTQQFFAPDARPP